MQQQTDINSSYYQYYQTHFQNSSDPQFNPVPPPYASAPPVSPSDYANYSSTYPSFPHNPDHVPSNHQSSIPLSLDSYYQHQNPINQNHTAISYDNSTHNPVSDYNPSFPSNPYSGASAPASYSSSSVPSYVNSLENDASYGGYGEQGLYDGGVYKYSGGKVESYGGEGGRPSDSGSGGGVMFDDYGRPINISGGKEHSGYGNSSPKIVKAVAKVDESQDVNGSIQKFAVNLLSEGFGQTDMDVLCQIGLDGIRILDPPTSRTLEIYPLETLTRWEVLDSYIFAIWAKTSVDPEPKRIRLKSNSYTTNKILDTVTAASIQVKEMGESSKPSDLIKGSEQSLERKKGFIDWMNLIKPVNVEKDHWVPDEAVTKCTACRSDFNAFNRKHHCRNCGDIFCDKCTQGRIALTADDNAQPVRVCDSCMAEVTQRLSNTEEAAARVAGLHSHRDLARKLQEEMEKNRKIPTGAKSEASGMRMRDVACPTCTVHLQVQIPATGSETIECSVCQHPFLVNAN
ncbi:RING/FYVE/PHD zinc finger superfamily protein [Abeliophyllum distichum]|uniref:RING/FYVE/PHD zinc finger superfamily protein n=1 Tax=Abeliophyllum distichum TaxID=126358 RepID=A0ABD1SA35_9LAMI